MLKDPDNPAWFDVSVEFCGGTHLSNTAEAESFALLEEVITKFRGTLETIVDVFIVR